MPGTQQLPKHYLSYLDSARGIAALMVLFYHFITWHYDNLIYAKLASFIFNGRDAVSFFFVLSGFVLSYKYIVLKKPLDVKKFFINRFLRLFPAFFVTVLVCILYRQMAILHFHNLARLSIFTKTEFWEEIYLFKAHTRNYGAGWTLVIELTISFFMPFIIAIAKVNRKLVSWLLITVILIMAVMNDFFVHFILGILASCYFFEITDKSFRQTKWYKYRIPLVIAAFILFSVRVIDNIVPFGSTYNYIASYFTINFFFFSGIGSFIFLVVILQNKKIQNILNHSVLRFYGKISYDIYLMHWIVVTVIFEQWDEILKVFHDRAKLAFLLTFIAYFITTTILATLVHYTIELPFIRFGKKITSTMKPFIVIE